MKRSMIAALAAVVLYPAAASGFNKPGRWTANTSPVYPIVRAFGCPNHFATNFPGFDWNRFAYQVRTAANTWFTEGTADLRLRYAGDLAASDPRCAAGSGSSGAGEILITAERNHGGGACHLATTFASFNGAGEVTTAKVIMHRGTVCGTGVYRDWSWDPGVDYPAASEFDFQSVVLHELGHAIGFDHSSDGNAVMFPSASPGESSKRNLGLDDIAGMQQAGSAYGTIQTTSRHRFAGASPAPTGWFDEGESIPGAILGAPAVAHSPLLDSSSFYAVALTRATDRAVLFGRTNGMTNAPAGFTQIAAGVTSSRPPAIASSTAFGNDVVAWADVSDTITVRRNTGSWSAPVSTGRTTRVAPSLAYLPGRNLFVLAWAEAPSGRLHTMLSSDNGLTWSADQTWSVRTFHSFGVTCRVTDECVIAYADGESPFSRLGFLTLGFRPATGTMALGSSQGTNLADTYGAAITTSTLSARTQLGWRDRGTATVTASGGWSQFPGTLDSTAWIPGVTSSAPRLAYNASWNEFTIWSSHQTRYDPK